MARLMSQQAAKSTALEQFPAFLRQRKFALEMDSWHNLERESRELYVPENQEVNAEYRKLASCAPTPWLALAINAVVQICYLDGVRRAGAPPDEMLEAWSAWQENGWDAKQIALYRSTLKHGLSYVRALPGINPITGSSTARWKAYSAKTLAAFFTEDDDEFPMLAIEGRPYNVEGETGYTVTLYDEVGIYYLSCKGEGMEAKDWTFIYAEKHEMPFTPFVEYANIIDLDGRTRGEIEPFIPLARRIDQDTFDRLIVQRYGAWKIRYVTGMVKPPEVSDEEHQANLIKLKINDFLVSDHPDTKFGTLEATQLDGFIKARDADLRDLSAVTQTPPHHMLGLSSNLQAESLQAVAEGLKNKTHERKTSWAESHERLFRVTALIRGNKAEAQAFDMQCRWRNMSSMPLSQAADALGKLAIQLNVPTTMLWEMIPDWTDTDVQRAKELVLSGTIDRLLQAMEDAQRATA